MVGPVTSNEIARRVVDDLIEFSVLLLCLVLCNLVLDDIPAAMQVCTFQIGIGSYEYCLKGHLDLYVSAGTLAKLSEVVESPRLVDKMKYVFGHSRGEDESLAGLMCDLFLSLRISLSKKRRLVDELEAAREVDGAVKCLEHMRVIVARDVVTLGELETLLGRAQVGVSLKAGFVADMEAKD
ncbi:hypothetical protein Tco_0321784 [Tanacetum coccineum]